MKHLTTQLMDALADCGSSGYGLAGYGAEDLESVDAVESLRSEAEELVYAAERAVAFANALIDALIDAEEAEEAEENEEG